MGVHCQRDIDRRFVLAARPLQYRVRALPQPSRRVTSSRVLRHLAEPAVRRARPQRSAETSVSPRIEAYEALSAMPDSGLALFRSAEQDSFDLADDWFRLLAGHGLAEGSSARYYALLDDGVVRCVLPVRISGRHEVHGLTTFYTTLYRPLLAPDLPPDHFATVVRHSLEDTGASSIRLDAMDTRHHSFVTTLAAMRLAGLQAFTFFSHGNWYLPASGLAFEDYFAALPSRVRNTVRRGEKRLLASGHVEILSGAANEDLERAVDAWQRIYAASWKRPEPFPDFMPGLIRLCAARRWLRMGIAYHENVPVAAQIWVVNAGRAAIYKLAYDQAFARLSAGTVLTARLMRHVLDEDRVDEVDYLVGDDGYKKDWMTKRRARQGIVAYDWRRWRGLRGMLLQALGQARRRLALVRETGAETPYTTR